MSDISRRKFSGVTLSLALAALALSTAIATPALAAGKTITAVMHSDLRVIDPGFTTAYITRDHGYMVYDTLLATDSSFKVQPQMADWKVSDDKLTYTFTLRDGLKWHDGAPVTAEDCVASLKRWGKSDGMGQKLMDFTASIEATDAKTITLKLKEPYGLVLESIAKPSSLVPFMMPKRLAETPAGKQMPEQIGSGPFKFVQGRIPARREGGLREEHRLRAAQGAAELDLRRQGGEGRSRRMDHDAGCADRGERAAVRRHRFHGKSAVRHAAGAGGQQGPEGRDAEQARLPDARADELPAIRHSTTSRFAARRLLAMNQKDVLDALVGNPKYYKICGAFFICDTPLATDAGAETLIKGNGMADAKKALAESGYDGTPVVIMAPGDVVTLKAQPIVVAQLLREAGFKVDLQATDWQTVVTRRASQKPPKEGGWNMFFTNWVARRRDEPDCQLLDRRQGQEWRLVRLGRGSQDRES